MGSMIGRRVLATEVASEEDKPWKCIRQMIPELWNIPELTDGFRILLTCSSRSVRPCETMDQDRLTPVYDVIDELQHGSEEIVAGQN